MKSEQFNFSFMMFVYIISTFGILLIKKDVAPVLIIQLIALVMGQVTKNSESIAKNFTGGNQVVYITTSSCLGTGYLVFFVGGGSFIVLISMILAVIAGGAASRLLKVDEMK